MERIETITQEDLLEHLHWAKALARHLVGDEATADDVVQDSVLAALERPPRLASGGGVKPWLGSVVRNVVRQRGRSARGRRFRESEAALSEALPSSMELAAKAEGQRLLLKGLMALEGDARDLVLLRYFEGLSSAEIARRSGERPATVRSRLKRALDTLRDELDRVHGGDRRAWHAAVAPLAAGKAAKSAAAGLGGLPLAAAAFVVLVGAGTGVSLLREALNGVEPVPALAQGELVDPVQTVSEESTPALAGVDASAAARELPNLTSPAEALSQAAHSPSAEVAEVCRFRMRFVTQQGEPVPGVEVRHRGAVLATSGAAGRLECRVPARRSLGGATLRLRASGFATDTVGASGPAGETTDLGDVILYPGGNVAGRVVNRDGEPLVGLTVSTEGAERVTSQAGGLMTSEMTALGRTETLTSEDGSFELFGVRAGDVDVHASSENGVWRGEALRLQVDPGAIIADLVIEAEELDPRRRIEGIVLEADGTPVPYAGIGAEWRRFLSRSSQSRTADAEGRFVLIVPKGISADLCVSGRGEGVARAIVESVDAGSLDLVVRLDPPRGLELRVEDPGGAPVEGASAWIQFGASHSSAESTDTEGRVELPCPAGEFQLTVKAEGFAPYSRAHGIDAAVEEPELRIELQPIPPLAGIVRASGLPVAGAALSVRPLAQAKTLVADLPSIVDTSVVARAETRADGTFALTVSDRGQFMLRAEAEGFAAAEYGPFDFDPKEGLDGAELALTVGGRIEGRVFDGDTIREARVVMLFRGHGVVRTLETDLDGHFVFRHVPAGPAFVRVVPRMSPTGVAGSSSTWGAPFRAIEGDCVVREGQVTRFDIVMGDAAPRATLAGTVQMEGFDVTRLRVELVATDAGLQAAGVRAPVPVEADGTFQVQAGRPGAYHLILVDVDDPSEEPLRFLAPVELTAGDNSWSLAAPFCQIRTGPSATPSAERLLWRGPEGSLALGQLAPKGTARPFPAGPISRVSYLSLAQLMSLDDIDALEVLETMSSRPSTTITVGQ